MNPERRDETAGRPRVLAFIHSLEPGGVERVALRLCGEWARSGSDVTLAVGRVEGPLREEMPDVRVLSSTFRPFPRRLCETLWMILWLPGVILRVRPDVLFCPGNTYAVIAVALKILLGRRCPPIVIKISNDLRRRDLQEPVRAGYRWWCRVQGKRIDRFVAMSPAMRFEISRAMRVDRSRITTIHDAVLDDAGLARSRALSLGRRSTSDARRFLVVGRLVRQKNLGAVLDAFRNARRSEDVLLIAGDGPLRRTLVRRARRLGISSSVRFLGHVADVAPVMAAADFLVLGSLYEGVPAALIEGLAVGLRTIAADCCASMRSLVLPTGGFLLDRKSRGLAAAMKHADPRYRPSADGFRLAELHGSGRSAESYSRLFASLTGTRAFEGDALVFTPPAADSPVSIAGVHDLVEAVVSRASGASLRFRIERSASTRANG